MLPYQGASIPASFTNSSCETHGSEPAVWSPEPEQTKAFGCRFAARLRDACCGENPRLGPVDAAAHQNLCGLIFSAGNAVAP